MGAVAQEAALKNPCLLGIRTDSKILRKLDTARSTSIILSHYLYDYWIKVVSLRIKIGGPHHETVFAIHISIARV